MLDSRHNRHSSATVLKLRSMGDFNCHTRKSFALPTQCLINSPIYCLETNIFLQPHKVSKGTSIAATDFLCSIWQSIAPKCMISQKRRSCHCLDMTGMNNTCSCFIIVPFYRKGRIHALLVEI